MTVDLTQRFEEAEYHIDCVTAVSLLDACADRFSQRIP